MSHLEIEGKPIRDYVWDPTQNVIRACTKSACHLRQTCQSEDEFAVGIEKLLFTYDVWLRETIEYLANLLTRSYEVKPIIISLEDSK